MRIAPVLVPHLKGTRGELWQDVVAATVLTHRDEAAVAASVGFVGLLAECISWGLGGEPLKVPPERWWPDTFLRYARAVETGQCYTPRVPGDEFVGSLCDRVEEVVYPTLREGWSVLEFSERWRSGAYLLETVPCLLFILARYGHAPEEAIVRAVNDTLDNDTIAACVGAAVGALHGLGGLPPRWRQRLLGRTREDDDGRVQVLVERACAMFVR